MVGKGENDLWNYWHSDRAEGGLALQHSIQHPLSALFLRSDHYVVPVKKERESSLGVCGCERGSVYVGLFVEETVIGCQYMCVFVCV